MGLQLFEILKKELEIEEKCASKHHYCLYLVVKLEKMSKIVNLSLTSKTEKRRFRPIITRAIESNLRKVIFLSSQNDFYHTKLRVNMDLCIKKGCPQFRFQSISYAFQDEDKNMIVREVSEEVFYDEDLVKFCGTCKNLNLEF